MEDTHLTFRFVVVFFLTGTLLLLKANGMGMRPKGRASASSSSFNPFTTNLDLSSSLSDVAAAERNLLAFIRSCVGATSNAALRCPCAGNGKRCKDSLSICRNFKCICDPSVSTYDATSNKCVAVASQSNSVTTTTTTPSTTTSSTTTTITTTTTSATTTSAAVKFCQTSYTLSTIICTAGTKVGTITAANAKRYTISDTRFLISAAGQITLQNSIAPGTYGMITITAHNAAGSATATVTITVTCNGIPQTCAKSDPASTIVPTCSGTYPIDIGYPVTPTPMITTAEITVIVDTHNNYRRTVDATNMKKLEWDPCLSSSAQAWANKCDARNPHDASLDRRIPGFPGGCGQNQAQGTPGFLTWKTAIDLWYNEVKDFTYCGCSNVFLNVGHYTQVMWAETSLIGCGRATCNGMDVFMCNYCAPGNSGTEPARYCDLLYKQGPQCSACTGSTCRTGDCLCA